MRQLTPKEWADLLIDNVATVTQLDALPNIEDWHRNAEQLFRLIVNATFEKAAQVAEPYCEDNCGKFIAEQIRELKLGRPG